MSAIKQRETTIEKALFSAEKAREEIAQLQTNNQKLLEEAKQEQSKIISKAMDTRRDIIEEAKKEAEQVSNQMIEKAKIAIVYEKEAAILKSGGSLFYKNC